MCGAWRVLSKREAPRRTPTPNAHPLSPTLLLQLIHFIFVPAIVWSAAVWLAASGPLAQPPLSVRLVAAAKLPSWASSG